MKGISPIIATILLIVMTVAIAGLLYAWMQGLFNTLTNNANQGATKLTQITSFYISQVYANSGNLYAIIYNNGQVPIVESNIQGVAQEYYTANDSFDGNTYTCTSASTGTIAPGTQAIVQLNCQSTSTIISNVQSGNYYYVFTLSYNGVAGSATLS